MISPRIFLPLLDNGTGSVMASFMMDHATAFAGREVQMIRASDSHANRGMNKIANAFLESDCEVWINLDADIRFRRVDIDNLLSHNLSLVYGIYPKKEETTSPCLCTFATVPEADPETGLAEVRRCGRGFMLVRREVLEAMKEDNGGPALRYHNHGKVEWDFFPSGVVTGSFSALHVEADASTSGEANLAADGTFTFPSNAGRKTPGIPHDEEGYPIREWISEDWYFCEVARSLGYKTLVDTRIALGHVGSKEYYFGAGQVERVDGWRAIPGWFTEADAEVYRLIAAAIPADGVVAEIGTWLGRSMGALLSFCREHEKHPRIHAIDTFKGTLSEGDAHTVTVQAHGGSIRAAFEANIKNLTADFRPLGSIPIIAVHEADSIAASKLFPAQTFDAVFIDGDHTLEAVRHDIIAWLPTVKSGGIIAGHDYDYPEVAEAVHEMFLSVEAVGRCWLVRL